MSGHHPPLTCSQVKAVLAHLGFSLYVQKNSSHEQWKKPEFPGKVTVDCPKAPFSHDLVGYMAKQAGVSKKDFYNIHFAL
ncbi:type II toxin-antitoxin system HicA family toxin [Methylomicrobium lacus]|uniref:type II toxin-antitoxin system HicA family toxin n=1 Tax=Methylomicrobium lacus TaxID=136992 RepID=UPI000A065177|nr:type II toxin-antitoxin system HicA family toxin [Methylomicrobium lacus]